MMPFVEALDWYADPKPCQTIAGNSCDAHIAGIRHEGWDWILCEIRIESFLHIHAVDLNIELLKLRTIYAKALTEQNSLENRSAVYVEDFPGRYIRQSCNVWKHDQLRF